MALEQKLVAEVVALQLRPSCAAVVARQPEAVVVAAESRAAEVVAVALLEGRAVKCQKYLETSTP